MKKIINMSMFIFITVLLLFNNSLYVEAKVHKYRYNDSKEVLNSVDINWWNKFNDPILVKHIHQMLHSNNDLKKAILNISVSRAKVRESFGRELPQMSLLSDFIRINPPSLTNGKRKHLNVYALPLYANYELDLWQKNRKRTVGQKQLLKISYQDARTICIIQISELVSAYINILKLDKLIEMQQKIIDLEKKNLEIAKKKYKAGLVSLEETLVLEQNLTNAEKTLKKQLQQREVFINYFKVLKGEPPEQKLMLARGSIDTFELPEKQPLEFNSKCIMQRPDILKAEAQLKYAKINVSIARREFLPDINIYGLFGFNSFSLGKLFNWDNYLASIGTSLVGELFTGGQKKARLKQKKYEYEQVFQNYQKVILTSLQEVNDSLYALKTDLEIFKEDQNNLSLEAKNFQLVNLKYKTGLVSFQETLPVEKKTIFLQQEITNSKAAYLLDSINIYKAMGGQVK